MSDRGVNQIFNADAYKDESAYDKFMRKAKDAPFMPIGIASSVLGIMYGVYRYRRRGEMSTSIYLIHMRVAAQGAVVAALSLGVGYQLLKDYVFTSHPAEVKKD